MAADSEVTAHSVAASVRMLPLPSYLRRARESWREYRDWSAPHVCCVPVGCIPRKRPHVMIGSKYAYSLLLRETLAHLFKNLFA